MVASATVYDNQMGNVYGEKPEIMRLATLINFAGYRVVDMKTSPRRPSHMAMMFDLSEREQYEVIDLSWVSELARSVK